MASTYPYFSCLDDIDLDDFDIDDFEYGGCDPEPEKVCTDVYTNQQMESAEPQPTAVEETPCSDDEEDIDDQLPVLGRDGFPDPFTIRMV